MTLDQDSVCAENLIQVYEKYIEIPDIATITSCVIDRNFVTEDDFLEDEDYRFVTYCITWVR